MPDLGLHGAALSYVLIKVTYQQKQWLDPDLWPKKESQSVSKSSTCYPFQYHITYQARGIIQRRK